MHYTTPTECVESCRDEDVGGFISCAVGSCDMVEVNLEIEIYNYRNIPFVCVVGNIFFALCIYTNTYDMLHTIFV
jgi:hypothetical protein